jgi:triacylglycerol lipase
MHAGERVLPVIFVRGNGDTPGLWITTLWRFESNGYPRELLHAVDLRYPTARRADANPERGRSSAPTRRSSVILVGQSRGGKAARNYLKNGGNHVAAAFLCGATNHGVIVSDQYLVGSEFNGDRLSCKISSPRPAR